ncbi:HAD family hydrolase [Kineosporia succinea]|uniref:HAD superfamily hydrolase (TIGR01662 family) n=1 Tax=Kineosporia succinea TaxID=84632 RepID=A0ABT9P3P7_9ACTN|nr:HAD family hydrolase [Kineosporia succinea]MDP9827302.1 HAD superfamily hydrolase (TIGR01662 family) [Kineosporia succinea]
MSSSIQAVFFDVGETLVDETLEYGTWADWLGIPRHTFSAVFGAIIARGSDYREVFQYFRPGFDLAEERQRRVDAGLPESFSEQNLYPDARTCLASLQQLGLTVGVAGNQTARAETILRALKLPIDVLGTSDSWNAEKPSIAFFERLVQEAGCPAGEILYVGDRLDNDLLPALDVGLEGAVIKRGPWAHIWADRPELERCLFQLDSLAELPDLVAAHNKAFEF